MLHTSARQHRQRDRSLSANGREKDEDLVLFQEMQQRERAATRESMALPLHQRVRAIPPKSAGEDIFSSSERDEHDYDWLMMPPVTRFLSSPEQNALVGLVTVKKSPVPIAKGRSSKTVPSYRAKPLAEAAHGSFDKHKPADPNAGFLTSTSSVSRKSLSATTCPSTPSRLVTSISRPIARSSTPSKSAAFNARIHASTPTGQAATPSNCSVSSMRPSTPIKKPGTVSSSSTPSKPLSVNKTGSLRSKSVSSVPPSSPSSRTHLPAIRPVVIQGASQELTPNQQTSAADRPLSNPRGSMALKANSMAVGKVTQRRSADLGSCNRHPSSSSIATRGHISSDSSNGGKSFSRNGKPLDAAMLSMSNCAGSKAVDKTMPPRKPITLSQEKRRSVSTPVKKPVQSTPPDDTRSTSRVQPSSGFGRHLSKESIDVAFRNMDARGSELNGFQSFMSNVPVSSLYSVKSRNSRGMSNGGNSTSTVMSSPMATSSNASSEHGMSIVIDPENSELGDESSSEMGSRASPVCQQHRSVAFSNERKVSHWLGSPGFMDGKDDDIMQMFESELASLSGTESPLLSHPEGSIDYDDFSLEQ